MESQIAYVLPLDEVLTYWLLFSLVLCSCWLHNIESESWQQVAKVLLLDDKRW